nr:hypothetical protein CPGR_05166 [Mycolicibacter nonchromogenicus]
MASAVRMLTTKVEIAKTWELLSAAISPRATPISETTTSSPIIVVTIER